MIGIALFVCGVIFLVKGRVPYGKKKEVRGPLVYLVACLLLLPLPIFGAYYFIEGFNAGAKGKQLDMEKLARETLMIELPVYLGVALFCWAIVAFSAQPVKRKKRRYDDDDDYYEDDDRRPVRRFEDDDEERRPRRRYADDDDDDRRRYADDEGARPRRRGSHDDDERDDRWRQDDDRERRRY